MASVTAAFIDMYTLYSNLSHYKKHTNPFKAWAVYLYLTMKESICLCYSHVYLVNVIINKDKFSRTPYT